MEVKMIVRRFTDKLEGSTDLEQATISAQLKQDGDALAAEQLSIQKKIDNLPGNKYVSIVFAHDCH